MMPPIVLAERAKEIFEGDEDSPFMLVAKGVRPAWRERIPAIVHVDGTARVQTVRQEHNQRLHALLSEFETITGVPVLLNTSFNVKGEPIVETPDDAIKCFLTTGIDYLVLHDVLLAKKPFHKVLAPTVAAYSDIATIVRAALTTEMRH
jgi:carbamoyltransferase